MISPDAIDLPLAAITPEMTNKLHSRIGIGEKLTEIKKSPLRALDQVEKPQSSRVR
jgi:hypothetical protein